MVIHPEFDGTLWFYGDAEAKTIRELLKTLPQGTRVGNYYPKGYGHKVKIREARRDEQRPLNQIQEQVYDWIPEKEKRHPAPMRIATRGLGEWTDELTQEVMRLYEAGQTREEIGAKLGFSRNAISGKIDRERKKLVTIQHREPDVDG